jgi:hypothetical protein
MMEPAGADFADGMDMDGEPADEDFADGMDMEPDDRVASDAAATESVSQRGVVQQVEGATAAGKSQTTRNNFVRGSVT